MAMTLEVTGNACKDAEIRMTRKGDSVAYLTVASNRRGPDGETVDTDYVRVVVYGTGDEGDKYSVAAKIRKGDYVVARGPMSSPVVSEDGKYANYHVAVNDDNVWSQINRQPKRESQPANVGSDHRIGA